MRSPYVALAPQKFWKTGVRDNRWKDQRGLYDPKFRITKTDRIMTSGSCFAQHIATNLRKRGFNVVDTEPALPGMSDRLAKQYGYRLYSARYGNIYTPRQLLQVLQDALGQQARAAEVWTKEDRFYDASRPSVEPFGLRTAEEVQLHRTSHLKKVARAVLEADVFIFTFGLTEAWMSTDTKVVFPTAPGTIAGDYDPAKCSFVNFGFCEVYEDFCAARELVRSVRPDIRFIVTVSPVPLTSTASSDHVLPATIYSKSVLRAAAGQISKEFDDVDYFPSYEIISTPFTGQMFYDSNLRSVLPSGVETVMGIFFREHDAEATDCPTAAPPSKSTSIPVVEKTEEDIVCEEMLLEAFAR